MTYGEKLIQLRKNANMTQADLGEKLGVTAQAVSKWEHDVSEPDLGTLRKISSIFGVSVDDFLDAEKEVVPVVPVNPAEVAQEMAPVVAAGVREDIVAGVREGINDSTDAIKTTVKEVGDAVLGHCIDCGITVREANKGQTSPKVLCAACYKKRVAAKKAQEEEIKRKTNADRATLRSKRNRCLFWGILAGLGILAGAIITAIKVEMSIGAKVGVIIGGVWAGYAILGVICEVSLSDSAVAEVMEWGLTRSISWPGVIFSLDWDGIIFLIAIKVLFAIIGFIAGVALFFLALSISMVIATFTFPFSMARIDGKIRGRLPIKTEDLM